MKFAYCVNKKKLNQPTLLSMFDSLENEGYVRSARRIIKPMEEILNREGINFADVDENFNTIKLFVSQEQYLNAKKVLSEKSFREYLR